MTVKDDGIDLLHRYLVTGRRVIINTDAKNEADDQFAIAQAILSPLLDIRAIIAAHFGSEGSMQASRDEVDLVLDLAGFTGLRVENGAEHELPDELTPVESAGARVIIEESLDGTPLLIAFLGPLTDMASAILMDPAIVGRDVGVIWIGGPPYGGILPGYGPESNLIHDVHAANVVFGSGIPLWQIPMNIYMQMSVSHEEFRQKVRPHGPLGQYLCDQLLEYCANVFPLPMESHSLGDNPAIGVLLNPIGVQWVRQGMVRFTDEGRMLPAATGSNVTVADAIDSRYILEDLFTKLAAHAAAR